MAGVSIKFEVGSWLGKNNRLYEQGAARALNLGESGSMLPQEILKSGSSEMPFPAFWAPNRVQKIKEDFLSTATFFFIFTTLISWKWQLVCIVTKNFLSICLFSFPTNSFINSSREKKHTQKPIRSISCSLQLRLNSNKSKNMMINCWNGRSDFLFFHWVKRAWLSFVKVELSFEFWFIRTATISYSTQ